MPSEIHAKFGYQHAKFKSIAVQFALKILKKNIVQNGKKVSVAEVNINTSTKVLNYVSTRIKMSKLLCNRISHA